MNSEMFNVFKLSKAEGITTGEADLKFSKNIDYPRFSLGFQHYIHQSKLKMNMINPAKGKKKVYLILNSYEMKIDDYDNSIGDRMEKVGGSGSRLFCVMWELMSLFYVGGEKGGTKVLLLDSRKEDSLRSIVAWKKYYGVSGDMSYYWYGNVNSEIVKEKFTMEHKLGVKVDLVVGDVYCGKGVLVTQEQTVFTAILRQVAHAIQSLNNKGTLILKVYEIYTGVMAKLVGCLTNLFGSVYVCKPCVSRLTVGERFIVCKGFGSDKKLVDVIVSLAKRVDSEGDGMNIVGMFSGGEIGGEYLKDLIRVNVKMGNDQFMTINNMVTYVEKQNYRGAEYNKRRSAQIEASGKWYETFVGGKSDLGKIREVIGKEIGV